MRAETFEIRWHDTQPIYSCSFQHVPPAQLRRVLEHNRAQAAGLEPGKVLSESEGAGPSSVKPSASSTAASASAPSTASRQALIPLSAQGQSWRFATAGGDNHARIWLVHPNIPSPAALAAAAQVSGSGSLVKHRPRVDYRATLRRHSGVVNCVRFSPREELLATTGDDGMVLLWIPSDGPPSTFGSNLDDDNDAEFAKEHWRLRTMSRASSSEIYDLAWSPSGDALVIGGTDFVARIVSANDGTVIREISEHSHYIQGVTWDPLSEYIATQSSDRSVHVHQLLSKAMGELSGVQIASRNSKLEFNHRRNTSSGGQFVWDHMKPSMKRRDSSHASDSEREQSTTVTRPNLSKKRSNRSSTPLDIVTSVGSSAPATNAAIVAPAPNSASSSSNGAQAVQRAATPTQNQSPALAMQPHSMNPPQRTPSRRSSFSGSQIGSPPTSATSLAPSHPPSIVAGQTGTGGGASGSTPLKTLTHEGHGSTSRSVSRSRAFTPRSPSPAPPLPAIRAPPSPQQRIAVLQAANAGPMARLGMRLYGDETSTGFFRRLTFSPDGALLVTPTGVFESVSAPATATGNVMQSPASPTVATLGRDAVSPGSPLLPTHSVLPGVHANARDGPLRNTVYMYARGNLHRSNAPIAHLPGHKTAALVVKFSPILYELRKLGHAGKYNPEDDGIAPHPTVPLEAGKQKTVALSSAASMAGGVASSSSVQESVGSSQGAEQEVTDDTSAAYDAGSTAKHAHPSPSSRPASAAATASPSKSGAAPSSMIGLPYRMIFAVATHDSVWIYDTQQGGPLCCFSNMHYASFTDLTWSPDGQTLMMCSTDGYCSIVVFDYGELGTPYSYASQPSLQQPSSQSVRPTQPSAAATSIAKMSGSPMMRRTSAQSLPGQQHATPPSVLSHHFGGSHAGGISGSELSPSMGLGLMSDSDSKDGHHEIDPPVIPAHESPMTGMAANAGTMEIGSDNANGSGQARKKRRIAPTLEGPIGS